MSDAKLKSDPTMFTSFIIFLVTFVDYMTDLLLQWIPINEWIQTMVFETLEKINTGCLRVTLPSGETKVFGNTQLPVDHELSSSIKILNPQFFWRIATSADTGLGESYMYGEWETDDLVKFFKVMINNKKELSSGSLWLSYFGQFINNVIYYWRKNTVITAKKNIQDHYDLGNEMFELFLDPTMTYSCAIYKSAEETLYEAQQHKLDAMISKARIQSTDHVLEIGSGWGALAIAAVKKTGCRVTSITLSEEQLKEAKKRAKAAGVADKIKFRLCDYRKISGQFDKIISVEMLEAVGHEYLGTYFNMCDKLLKPNGLCVIQVITVPDQSYDNYRKNSDWINKYIFPGGLCPSLTALSQAMTQNSSFIVEDLDNIGIHYARTLREWRLNFLKNEKKIRHLYSKRDGSGFDDEFIRKWIYYLAICESGFATRTLFTLQLVLTRPNNQALPEFA